MDEQSVYDFVIAPYNMYCFDTGQSTVDIPKTSLTGLQFAAEEKQKAKSEEKIEAKAAPLTQTRTSTSK